MRVLYVAPRYHTNQIPIMRGWIREGSKVRFVSQFASNLENYSDLQPEILGYSSLFEMIAGVYYKLFCHGEKSDKKEYDFRSKAGFPPIGSARTIIGGFEPDVVILRERSLYNLPFAVYCKRKRIPCILYNQTALFGESIQRLGLAKRLLRALMPRVRMTPVKSIKETVSTIGHHEYYVPFVQEIALPYEEKHHFRDGKVQVLCVARYEARKNLLLLVDAYAAACVNSDSHLTIIGEKENQDQEEYYNALLERIVQLGLDQNVSLLVNCTREEVFRHYQDADFFVLPSTRERASISQLEAMSFGLPVLCSDTNGTACYVAHGETGMLFIDNDQNDLQQKLKELLSDRDRLLQYGKAGYDHVKKYYQFQNYKYGIETILAEFRS